MNNYLANLDWQSIAQTGLIAIMLGMIYLFRRPASNSIKALKLGAGIFMVSIFLNILEITRISDYFIVVGFIIMVISLLRIFWSDTSKTNEV